jgi:predicted DCC family thiol-disulfide oxidoreductase YuxK
VVGTALSAALRPAGHRGERPEVGALTVLYDADCPVCRASKQWLMRMQPLVDVHFVAVGSEVAVRRFPSLDMAHCRQVITVVTDTGHVYRGDRAFIMCLWAMRRTRSLALAMAAGRRATLLKAMVGATSWCRELMLHTGCDEACQTRLS